MSTIPDDVCENSKQKELRRKVKDSDKTFLEYINEKATNRYY